MGNYIFYKLIKMETLLIVKNLDEFGILFDFNELKKRKLAKGGYGVV